MPAVTDAIFSFVILLHRRTASLNAAAIKSSTFLCRLPLKKDRSQYDDSCAHH